MSGRLPLGPYRRVLGYFGRYRRQLALGAACVLLSRLLLVGAPRFLREALHVLQEGGEGSVEGATAAAWGFLGISAAAGLFTWLQRLLLVGASREVERDLKRDLFAHVERMPVAAFDRTRTGDLLARLTGDVEAVRFSLGPGVMYVMGTGVLFPVAIASMADLSLAVTLVALVPLLSIMLLVRVMAPGIMRATRAVQDRLGDLSARAQESFAGARVVRAYATEPLEVDAFGRLNRALIEESVGLARRRAALTASLYLLGGMAQLAVLFYGGGLVMEGRLHLGDLSAFLLYVGMLVWPMISVGWVVSAFQRSAAAMQRIDEVFAEPLEVDVHGEPILPPDVRGDIRVEGLTFRYPTSASPALDDVSLHVPAGRTLALVGPVGAGKSTLLALLTRLYEPPRDTVRLDGVDVTLVPLAALRRAFAVVPQDAFLFTDTLAGNLAYAVEGDLSDHRALSAAGAAGLAQDLEAFPRGLQTLIGERGITLSGGQRQRATLARALLRDAPVLLLDDALSSVDTQTESLVLRAIEQEMRRRTVVIVAHRLSTIRSADLVVVLDRGRVAEAGTHDELLALGGWYARTWADQRLEAELEDVP